MSKTITLEKTSPPPGRLFRRLLRAALLAAICGSILHGAAAGRRTLVLVSVDGMHPDYVLQAERLGLKIPNLRRMLASGTHAKSVRSVMPTVTYACHTTIATGVPPSRHGIGSNMPFDPLSTNLDGWNWYFEDIQVPTIWEAAAKAGYRVGSINWPVTVGAPHIQFNVPEFWRAKSPDDLKLMRVVSSPGLLAELTRAAGEYSVMADEAADWVRVRYAAVMLKEKRVQFLTLHLAALDHTDHDTGPFSPASLATMEETDKMVGELEKAVRQADPNGILAVVSDHGLSRVDHELLLNAAFAQAGLLKPVTRGLRVTVAPDWKAQPWFQGGSAAVMLKDPKDEATRAKVARLLADLAAKPENGIAQVLDRKRVAELGGMAGPDFWVDMKPNYSVSGAMTGPVSRPTRVRGVHGYSPEHPEMLCSFLIVGPGIRKGAGLGDIDLRHIAPTVAAVLGVKLPSAELPALPVWAAGK